MSDSLWPHESEHTRPPCPSPTPGVHSDSCPLSRWCHPAISSSVVPFSSCPQSLPASESFPISRVGSDIFLPGKCIQTSQSRSCLSRLQGGLLGPGSSEASWDVVGLPGRASVFLSFLVMQSLVRHRNKKLIFWTGKSHLWGIIFYEPKTTVLLIYLNSRYYEQMSQLPLCAFGKYGWEMEWSRPSQSWLAQSAEVLIFLPPNM